MSFSLFRYVLLFRSHRATSAVLLLREMSSHFPSDKTFSTFFAASTVFLFHSPFLFHQTVKT